MPLVQKLWCRLVNITERDGNLPVYSVVSTVPHSLSSGNYECFEMTKSEFSSENFLFSSGGGVGGRQCFEVLKSKVLHEKLVLVKGAQIQNQSSV